MYNALRKQLNIDKRRLSHVWNLYTEVEMRRYSPMWERLPDYNPLTLTLKEAERRALYMVPDDDAVFAFGAFQEVLNRLENLQCYAQGLVAFDYTYDYDEYPRLLTDLLAVNTDFNEVAAGMGFIHEKWKDDWEHLVQRNLLDPEEYEEVLQAYHDTMKDHQALQNADFQECSSKETPSLLRQYFNAFKDNDIRYRAEILSLGVERAEILLERILYIIKCEDDGILEDMGEDFWPTLEEAEGNLSEMLPELVKEFLALSQFVNTPKERDDAQELGEFSTSQALKTLDFKG